MPVPSVHPRVCGERFPQLGDAACEVTVHPRVCGERLLDGLAPCRCLRFIPACAGNAPASIRGKHDWTGSSPRVRGTLLHRCEARTATRFIPACAGNAHPVPRWKSPVSVHPRVCGERSSSRRPPQSTGGSSPRVRGTRQQCRTEHDWRRFIPACAGNALLWFSRRQAPSVHPRVCGERESSATTCWRCNGSSPRVRGTRIRSLGGNPRCRFIPACAGNAPRWPCAMPVPSVHPRVCGERFPELGDAVRGNGSSPRVRGTPLDGLAPCRCLRFIPACAGNAPALISGKYAGTVHPRVCGERCSTVVRLLPPPGSSPRVRGTRIRSLGGNPRCRFIPACAGNARVPDGRRNRRAVHPRVCGERGSSAVPSMTGAGSSPRVRGTLSCGFQDVKRHRFIPACAGNAKVPRQHAGGVTVHPRVCGERLCRCRTIRRTAGSSPRVRGTPSRESTSWAFTRFIPACAGNAKQGPADCNDSPVHPRVCGER